MDSKHQKLIDICFQLVLVATDQNHRKFFYTISDEDKAEWVRTQLKGCGFDTKPCGSSWGVLN